MTTICPGWSEPAHAPIVLANDGRDDGWVSHGMCPECYRRVTAELDAPRQTDYAVALTDPRRS